MGRLFILLCPVFRRFVVFHPSLDLRMRHRHDSAQEVREVLVFGAVGRCLHGVIIAQSDDGVSQMALTKHREFQPHIQIMLAIFETADNCRRENNALRSILRRQGLSDRAIQSRVRRILKRLDLDETGAQAVKRACEESLKRWLDLDAQEVLAKIDLKNHPVQ
jgi:hypothetical protein